jgi:hypothetical protein
MYPTMRTASFAVTACLVLTVGCATRPHTLDEMLALYEEYDLPQPPKDAELCLYKRPGTCVFDREEIEYDGALVFASEDPIEEEPLKCTVDLSKTSLRERKKYVPFEPSLKNARRTQPLFATLGFECNSNLAMALHCKDRGLDELAQFLHARSKRCWDAPPDAAHLAWQYCRYRFVIETGGRRPIIEQMKRIARRHPLDEQYCMRLYPNGFPFLVQDDWINRGLIADMEATLEPRRVPNDKAERLVESLIDCPGERLKADGLGIGIGPDYEGNPVTALKRMGFDAVPALLGHLDDRRITREIVNVENAPPLHGRVCEYASEILCGLMAQAWCWRMEQEEVRPWWREAEAMGEEQYLLSKVFPEEPGRKWPRRQIVEVIAAKYPAHLPLIYGEILEERPNLESQDLAYALAGSELPKQVKIASLVQGAEHPKLCHKRPALFSLFEMDYEGFEGLLLQALEEVPATPDEPYWHSAGWLAILVAESESPDAWEALLRTARRVDLGTRMEFISRMSYCCTKDTPLKPRINFARQFLDDTAVRDINSEPEMYEGPCAGFTHERIAVRDFAALELAYLLDLDLDEARDWTEGDWAKLRQRVAARLKQWDVDQEASR